MNPSPPKRKTPPYWLALSAGIVLSCILMNLITFLSQFGMFNSWTSLNAPPSGGKRIIDASFSQIWVETQNGRLFTADIRFRCENEDMCWEWESVDSISEIPQQEFPIIRGDDCRKLRGTTMPSNPKGGVVECVYANYPGPEFWEEGYFVLMPDGNVFYWRNGGSIIGTQVFFIFSTFLVPFIVAVMISAVYLVLGIIHRASRGRVTAMS